MIPRTIFEPEHELFRDNVRKFLETEAIPHQKRWEEEGQVDRELWSKAGQQGFLAPLVAEQYGGVAADAVTCCLVTEEIARVDGSCSLMLVNHLAGLAPLIAGSTEEQRSRFLPAIVEEGHIVGFALTEPEAGSDAASLQTRARKEGNGYRLTGTKCFITNGGVARVFVLFATLDPAMKKRGITAYLVEEENPGARIGKKEDKMGMRASPTTELILEDAFVPEEARIGGEGEGWGLLIEGLSETRILIAALSLGLADGATEAAARYAVERSQFGKAISTFQGIQFMLADMLMGIETTRALVYRAARMQDQRHPTVRRYASMAKCYASDMAMRVTTDAVQMMGGYGYMKDYPVERMMRDAKVLQIFEGTNQVQRMIIARDYLASL